MSVRPWCVPLALLALAAPVRGADAPPAAPAAPRKAPRPPPAPGIHWERDLDAALRRAVREGRPVYVCENGRIEEGEAGTTMLARAVYPSAEVGDASRGFVCLVANGATHATKTVDGEEVCERYGTGTCACHQAVVAFVLERFSADGVSIVSPSHFLLDADLRDVYAGEYQQSVLSGPALDGWFARLSPRLAQRRVWSAREARTDALGKAATKDLEQVAATWIETKDPWAVVGVAATLDQEPDVARRVALAAALGRAGGDATPFLVEPLFDATETPDAEPALTAAWCAAALRADPDVGAWATARALLRTKDDASARRLRDAADALSGAARARVLEAVALRSKAAGDLDAFVAAATEASWPAVRVERVRAACGRRSPVEFGGGTREGRRRAWWAATAEETKAARALALEALRDPAEDVRVAAAIALRRAGDPAGADVLARALADPVELPEVRAALVALTGEDRGDSAEAWDEVLRGGGAR
ncbi:MAG: hypothetical protein IT460_14755 [Planctomycetes bacterium]|nr:hypothetical protein [Planctomycetota bacterium]